MNKKLIVSASTISLLLLPLAASAFINPGAAPIQQNLSIVGIINNVLQVIWPIFIGFAVIMLIWAGFLFLTARGEEEKAKQARQAVIWAVVGIAVGIIAFSLPLIIRNSLGVG